MTAAAILAGGRGQRLGGAVKPLLIVEGTRIIDRQLLVLGPLFDRIVIVANDGAPFADLGVDVIPDQRGPRFGPLAGLAWLPPRFQSVICVAGDMPFLSAALLSRLRDTAPSAAVVPRLSTGPEPLCARYDRSVGPFVASELAAGTRAMRVFLSRLAERDNISWLDEPALRLIDPDLRTFVNLNTPDDLVPP
jgi:molybdopterin-guanine dinucleotide biosynthesis protein A